MDFLSTPMPTSSGSEEQFVKTRPKINPTWLDGKRLPRRYFNGKNVNEWCDILDGDRGTILHHINNNTMMTYGPYRKYLGLDKLPIATTKRRLFEGKTVKEWVKILDCDRGECLKHIRNGTMLNFNPYRLYMGLEKRPNRTPTFRFNGKGVDEWIKILNGGDKGTIRRHIKNGTMEQYNRYRLYADLNLKRNQNENHNLHKQRTN